MSEHELNFPIHHDWPPLVEIKSVASVVRLRDVAITLLAWALLLRLLRTAIWFVVDWVSHPFGQLSYTTPPDWAALWEQLSIFIYAVLGLACWLAYYGIIRRRDLKATLTEKDQPLPLPIESEAALHALPVEVIHAWRKSKLLTLACESGNSLLPRFEEVRPAAGSGS